MARWLAVLCAGLAFAVVAVGCGDDEEKSDTGGGSAQTTEEAPATTEAETQTDSAKGKETNVVLNEIQFQPAEVTIKQGDIVKWTNEEDVGHDVTSKSGPKKFKSGDAGAMGKGDSFLTNFTAKGNYDYVCTIHTNMKGTITVE